MIISIYSINDALNGFGAPTLQNNDAAAYRSFAEVFKDVFQPADYSLWKLGSFDTSTGEIIPEVPTVVCRATDFVKGEEDNGK